LILQLTVSGDRIKKVETSTSWNQLPRPLVAVPAMSPRTKSPFSSVPPPNAAQFVGSTTGSAQALTGLIPHETATARTLQTFRDLRMFVVSTALSSPRLYVQMVMGTTDV
jgi:hypothetical protein